jgi:adenylate kinase family enzyme
MQYRRILVLGCCGSGKTTFADRLGALTGLPVVHLDKLYWKPGWTEPVREEFDAVLRKELSADEWIIDGNYSRTLPMRLERCAQVIYFDFPRLVCLKGILKRYVQHRGTQRADIGGGCPEKMDWAFIKYTWNFNKINGLRDMALVKDSGKPLLIFRSRRDAKKLLEACAHDQA